MQEPLTPSEISTSLLKIKQVISSEIPDFQANITKAWGEIIEELGKVCEEIDKAGSEVSSFSVTSLTPG